MLVTVGVRFEAAEGVEEGVLICVSDDCGGVASVDVDVGLGSCTTGVDDGTNGVMGSWR